MQPASSYPALSRGKMIRGSIAAAAVVTFPNIARAQASTLRVITYTTAVGALPYYAQVKGYYKDAGIAVELPTMNQGAAILAAVAGGSAEIGSSNVGTIATGVGKGLPFTVVADSGLYSSKRAITVLVTARNSPYQKAADLDGTTLGINGLGGLQHAGLMAYLDKNGGDSKSVKFVELGFTGMGPALEAGRVAAVFIAEPQLTEARTTFGRVLANAFDAVGTQFSVSAYASNKNWLPKNASLAHGFRTATERAAKWANDNLHDANALLAQFMKIEPAVISAMVPTLYPTSLEASNLQPVLDVLTKYSFLPVHIDARTLMTRV